MNLLKTSFAALIFAIPLISFAHSNHTPSFEQRQARLEQRIHQGIRSGSLTRPEATRLFREQRQLRVMYDRARADRKITAREWNRLQHAENLLSQHIFQQRHDAQYSYSQYNRTTYSHYAYR